MPLSDEQIDGIIERTCGYYDGPMLNDLRALVRAVEEAVAPAYAELLKLEDLHAKQSAEQAARLAELEAERDAAVEAVKSAQKDYESLTAIIRELEAERDKLRERHAEELGAKVAELWAVDERIRAIYPDEATLDGALAKVAEQAARLAELEAERDKLVARIAETERERHKLRAVEKAARGVCGSRPFSAKPLSNALYALDAHRRK